MKITNGTSSTLQDALVAIENADLSAKQKQELSSAVRVVSKALGLEPFEIPANVAFIREKFSGLSHVTLGVSQGRFANIRSYVGKAVSLVSKTHPSRNTAPLSPEWLSLLAVSQEKLKKKISAGLRFLSGRLVTPASVQEEDLLAYQSAIVSDRMRANPEAAWDHFLWAWNRAVESVPGWPKLILARPDRRGAYCLPLETFPRDFAVDLDAYQQRLANTDLDEDGPLRPASASTIKARTHQMRVAASILVHQGVGPTTITSLAKLVELPNFKLILRFLISRSGGVTSPQVSYMASALTKVAEYHARVDESALRSLKAVTARVSVASGGMTQKNRGRLRPFDDPDMVGKFLALPDAIRASVVRDKHAPVSKALLAQIAAAIALVQAVPMRRKNLAGIDMNRHLIPQRDRLYLVIPEAETKNRQAINLLLPRFTQEVVAWYVREYRPLLVRAPTTALFPGEGAGPKAAHTIGIQIAETVKTFLGIDFNTHMFRHVAGKIYLDKNPGAYEIVRQVLRHKSINTTTSFYTGAETRAANELYTSLVDDLRATYQANPYRAAAL